MGNRVVKRYYQPAGTLKHTTWNVRDAQGNILSVYERASPTSEVKQTEAHIYGSSRIGIEQRSITYSTSPFAWIGAEQHRHAGSKRYELTDHLGNVRVTVSDLLVDRPTGFGYATQDAEVIDRRDYYPVGMEMPGRRWRVTGEGAGRFGYNAQERDDEVSGEGNHYTAMFWEYDSRLGRRWNKDPKPNPSVSDYACLANNPIWFTDVLGDSSVVNSTGGVLHHDPKDKDKRVFALLDGKLRQIGTLGGKIDANEIYSNLLRENTKEAEEMYNPWTFRDNVKTKGKWDYKNDKNSVFGLGNDGKTMFVYRGSEMESQDIGNHHFGAVAKAYAPFLSEEFVLRKAGEYQIKSGTSKKAWQPVMLVIREEYIEHGIKLKVAETVKLPPYGDDPRDQKWIKAGFLYYINSKK
jgi:hypothetical protein